MTVLLITSHQPYRNPLGQSGMGGNGAEREAPLTALSPGTSQNAKHVGTHARATLFSVQPRGQSNPKGGHDVRRRALIEWIGHQRAGAMDKLLGPGVPGRMTAGVVNTALDFGTFYALWSIHPSERLVCLVAYSAVAWLAGSIGGAFMQYRSGRKGAMRAGIGKHGMAIGIGGIIWHNSMTYRICHQAVTWTRREPSVRTRMAPSQ